MVSLPHISLEVLKAPRRNARDHSCPIAFLRRPNLHYELIIACFSFAVAVLTAALLREKRLRAALEAILRRLLRNSETSNHDS